MNYYYNINPSSIHQIGKNYFFKDNERNYVFLPFDNAKEINSIYELSNILLQNGIPVHQIIPNIQNQLLTKLNNEFYVLMQIFVPKQEVTINDIFSLNSIYLDNEKIKLKQDNWYTLWTNKVDYFEYQISQIGRKYPLIIDSFSYYIGLSENAISLMNTIPTQHYLTLSHKRITCQDTYYRFYNPLNLVLDIRVRDACDYFKSCFFNNQDITQMVMNYLYQSQLNNEEACCFLARMLFPTYYFDMYEKIIAGELEEEKINIILSKVDNYEHFLKQIYQYLSQFYQIPEIGWLKKVS